MINLPPATLNPAAFAACCESLPDDVKERIAGAFPSYFAAALVFPGGALAHVDTKPGPAKTRPPAAPIDKDALAKAVLVALERHPKQRSEDYANKLTPNDYGATGDTIMGAVKKILEGMVTAKTAYCEGSGRGRRYHLAPAKAAESESAE